MFILSPEIGKHYINNSPLVILFKLDNKKNEMTSHFSAIHLKSKSLFHQQTHNEAYISITHQQLAASNYFQTC